MAVAAIFGCAIFVSHQYQTAREQCQKECTQVNPVSIAPPSSAEDCDECEQNAERNLPRWYRLFSWPEGIATWAVLLTLLAIAEQTNETRKTAGAALAQIQTMKARERAIVELLPPEPITEIIMCDNEDVRQHVAIGIENIGDTHAHDVQVDCFCEITGKKNEPKPPDFGFSTDVGTLRCSAKTTVHATVTASEEVWDKLIVPRARELYVHLWGSIVYRDIYGDPHGPARFHYIFTIFNLGDKMLKDGIEVLPVSEMSQFAGWEKCSHDDHNRVEGQRTN